MNAYIHTYIHTYVYVLAFHDKCISTLYYCIHTYMHACMHTYIRACMHAYIHTYIHACINTCMHAYIHTCLHAYIHTYMHACTLPVYVCIQIMMPPYCETWCVGRCAQTYINIHAPSDEAMLATALLPYKQRHIQ